MSDQRPRKKSRFFANGKDVLHSLLQRHPAKKTGDTLLSKEQDSSQNDQTSSTRPKPPALQLGSATSLNAALSSGMTPTANAFKELSVKEKESRRKGIYGAQELLAQVDNRHRRNIADATLQNVSRPPADSRSTLPWQQGDISQRSQQRQVSLVDASYDASHQSQFTFRAPIQPTIPRFPFQSNTSSHGGHVPNRSQNNSQPAPTFHRSEPVRAPGAAADLNVQKQRYTEPPAPSTPNFPAVSDRKLAPPVGSSTTASFRPTPNSVVDLDRDYRGRLFQQNTVGFTNLPPSAAVNRPRHGPAQQGKMQYYSRVPENALSSPDRLQQASIYAGRKRKRGIPVLPPPAFVFMRRDEANFNVFHGILLYPELCFHIAAHLPLEDLISLYAISKDFHTIIDTRFTTVILSQALTKAPTSSHIFPFRCYGHLCRKDPAARIPHPDPEKAALGQVRRIPSFKWLRMVLYREKAAHAIMALFAEKGIPLPKRCELSLKKMWFIMDIPDNARRIGFVHNHQLLTDADIYFAICFSVKLDMLLHDPVAPARLIEGRRLILGQPSMTMLLRVLKGEALSTRWDLMQEYIRWKYEPADDDEGNDDETLFGVPKEQWGVLRKEYWTHERPAKEGEDVRKSDVLLRPDQLVLREAIKRGLRFAGHYINFMQYGYVHPKTMENFEPRNMTRQIEEYKQDEYSIDDAVAGVRAMRIEDGGDPYLDLGRPVDVSTVSIKKEEISQTEREYRDKERGLIAQMYAESLQERRALGQH